jgi:hypothetical protein
LELLRGFQHLISFVRPSSFGFCWVPPGQYPTSGDSSTSHLSGLRTLSNLSLMVAKSGAERRFRPSRRPAPSRCQTAASDAKRPVINRPAQTTTEFRWRGNDTQVSFDCVLDGYINLLGLYSQTRRRRTIFVRMGRLTQEIRQPI